MSILSGLLKNPELLGSAAKLAVQNPQIFAAASSLLSSNDSSVGGAGGLTGLISAFESNGLGDIVASWVGSGENQSISADQLASALGDDTVSQFASKAGIDAGEAGAVLADMLPQVINMLTPDGQLPEASSLESGIAKLFS